MRKYQELTLTEKITMQIETARADGYPPEGYALQLVRDELRELLWNTQHRGDVLGLTVTLKDFEALLEDFAQQVGDAGVALTHA